VANALITPTVIAREALMQLDNNLVVAKTVHRGYDREYRKVGESITVRRPVQFNVTSGATLSLQDVEEAGFTMAMDQQKHVAWEFSSKDLTLTIEEYSDRYIKPAMIRLANQVDVDLLNLFDDVNNWAGTPGQDINSFTDFSKGPERLDNIAVPMDMRYAVLSPPDYWALVGSQTTLGSSDRLVETAYERARLGRIGNVEVYQAQNVATWTAGTRDNSTPLVNGAAQNVTYASAKTTMTQSLICDGFDASVTVTAGDVFTIAGVFDVNPVTKATLPHLKQFVVTTAGTASGGGALTLTIYPAIISSGAYQTVSAVPADNAALTFLGTASTGYRQNMVYHKNAFALVTAPLVMPDGAAFKAQETDSRNGLSVRVIKDYDMTNDTDRIRLDILYGVKTLDGRLATRLSGTA
jgi:hypothetical protein